MVENAYRVARLGIFQVCLLLLSIGCGANNQELSRPTGTPTQITISQQATALPADQSSTPIPTEPALTQTALPEPTKPPAETPTPNPTSTSGSIINEDQLASGNEIEATHQFVPPPTATKSVPQQACEEKFLNPSLGAEAKGTEGKLRVIYHHDGQFWQWQAESGESKPIAIAEIPADIDMHIDSYRARIQFSEDGINQLLVREVYSAEEAVIFEIDSKKYDALYLESEGVEEIANRVNYHWVTSNLLSLRISVAQFTDTHGFNHWRSSIYLIDVTTGHSKEIYLNQPLLDSFAFSDDGNMFIAAVGDQVQVINTQNGSLIHDITIDNLKPEYGYGVRQFNVSPDGKTSLIFGKKETLLIDLVSGEVTRYEMINKATATSVRLIYPQVFWLEEENKVVFPVHEAYDVSGPLTVWSLDTLTKQAESIGVFQGVAYQASDYSPDLEWLMYPKIDRGQSVHYLVNMKSGEKLKFPDFISFFVDWHPQQQVFLHMKANAELERDELTLSNVCGNIRTFSDFEGERIRTGRIIDGRRQLLVSGDGNHPEKGRALYLATSDQPIEKIVQLDPGESLIYRFYFEK